MNYKISRQRKHNVKLARLIIFILMLSCFINMVAGIEESHASRFLNIKAGFYGGPYYDVASLSYSDMSSMSGPVYTYSGVDSGSFMRICYAWGVSIPTLVDNLEIDLSSVNYFHMATDDGYGESITTFSASSLMGERYFYPHMIDMVDPKGSEQQTIDFSKVDSSITRGAQTVPTMIAVGNSDFSRNEAVEASRRGYKKYEKDSLGGGYRLMFGQLGLNSMGAANNVQASSRNINAINIQLAGSPNIIVDKNLISGQEGEIGSIYSIKIKIKLPESYAYLPEDVIKNLERQVLNNVRLGGYDKSVIKILEEKNGEYIVEIIGKGETDLTFRYSRKEYNGSLTIARGNTTIKGIGEGSGEGNTNPIGPTEPSTSETEPTQPIEPTQPNTSETEPTQPIEPTQPSTSEPEPTQPIEPTQPSSSETEPTQPSTSETEPTQPTEPTSQLNNKPQETESEQNKKYIGIDNNNKESGANNENKAKNKTNNETNEPAASQPQTQWISTDSVEPSANTIDSEGNNVDLWKLGAGAAILFLSGFTAGMISFFRRI